MSFSIIAATGKNNELGYKNGLIWNLKGDMKFFRTTTSGKTIVMGRKTFESLPKMLPNRKHIVMSSGNEFPPDVEVFHNIDDLLEKYGNTNEEIFVIGGEVIYRLFLDLSDKLYLTRINDSFLKADAYFPTFDENNYETEILGENEENNIQYKHVLYICL